MNRRPRPRPDDRRRRAITLLELLAVVTILVLLAGLVLGLAGYAQRKGGRSRAQAEISILENAIEEYRTDHGGYPTSGVIRITPNREAAMTNSWLLFAQLVGGSREYMNFRDHQLERVGAITIIVDPYGNAYDYYRPPDNLAAWTVSTDPTNRWASGGLHNLLTFDLSSYGPDRLTYIEYPGFGCSPGHPWNKFACASNALDDITNWP